MARDFSRKFYRSKQWKQQREYVLKRDRYLCRVCGTAAEEVHHIVHLAPDNINDVSISLDESNLISLCRDCHFNEHREDRSIKHVEEGFMFDENGYVVPSTIPPPIK